LEMRQVQTQIAERLNLEVTTEEGMERIAIRLHHRLMNEDKFLLILDDVWEKVDLKTLGVPQPEDHKGCKIILTSRRMEVCRSMMTDVDIKIDVLNDDEAWQLFCEKAGDVAHLEEIKPFAKEIVRECCGLPLAIIVVGAAMRRKTRVELWEHALNELRRSVPSIKDIEDEVYKPLKWSYDSLQGNNIKPCFLYCSLFPEDFSIKVSQLVQCWLGEGLIDEQNHVDSVNTGIDLIEKLKDTCLLEDGADEGTVKMHDVVRDVAIWIASSSEGGCKSLIRSGIGLSEISIREFSNSNPLKRVSFMNNKITWLPDCVIQCSEASTLLLQGNEPLITVPEKFLQGFVALRVLNLSDTSIQSLPLSLLQLGDLCALLLRNCTALEELPPLGEFSRLQMLDLSRTGIRELPKGMENLSNLRQLDLSCTMNLKTFQVRIISRLPCLEVLDMRYIAYYSHGKGAEEEAHTTLEELRHLDRLLFLCISFKRITHLSSEDLSWINKLRGFQIFIDPEGGFDSEEINTTNDKRVSLRHVDISQESIGQLWGIAKSLKFVNCQGLNEKIIDLGINSVGCFDGLKSLEICSVRFDLSLRPNGGLAARSDLLPNLEELTLYGLEGLESISELFGYRGLRFLKLKLLRVHFCYDMRYLLSCGDFIRTLPRLEVIEVYSCLELDELFNYDSGQNMDLDPVVPKLRTLYLQFLPKLRSICRHKETWPCLEQVTVWLCEHLKRLPLSNQNAGTIKEIEGESEWWNALEWDDHETKSSLLPYFRPPPPIS
jgi:disease resistance protein RPS2